MNCTHTRTHIETYVPVKACHFTITSEKKAKAEAVKEFSAGDNIIIGRRRI